eukprot:scaffold82554_cov16-Tisochrysis_lutea.AAC.1
MQATVADVMSSVQKNTDKGRAASTLLVFGDEGGGQGPTIPMCQSMERLADPQGEVECCKLRGEMEVRGGRSSE